MPDLITAAYAQAHIALGPRDLARLPGAIAAASNLARKHIGRYLTRRPSQDATLGPIDELVTPPLYGPILLSEYPIHDIYRVSTTRTPILSIRNTDDATNQRATARITQTGDPIAGLTPTGIHLERWASGVRHQDDVTFAGLQDPTIGALALAIAALGSGWTASPATADGSGLDYAPWPVLELRAGQGAVGALRQPALFDAWTEDAQYLRDDDAGMITLDDLADSPRQAARWGPTAGIDPGDDNLKPGAQGVRIVYDAGYDPIPDDLQQAVAEITKALLERKTASTTVQSERTDTWTISLREMIDAIPQPAREVLAYYRGHAR